MARATTAHSGARRSRSTRTGARARRGAGGGQATADALTSDDVLEMVAARFRVLADPSRLRLLRILMGGECSVQDLVDESALTQTNVSRHLGLMRRDGVVERTRDGNRALYRIADPTIEKVCSVVCDGLTRRRSDDLAALQGGSGI